MKIFTFDTTLRDGTQGEAVSFSVDDKLVIAQKLDELGIDYIEGGWPGSNPKDKEFFARARELKLKHAKLTAFGSTRFAKNPVERGPQRARAGRSRTRRWCPSSARAGTCTPSARSASPKRRTSKLISDTVQLPEGPRQGSRLRRRALLRRLHRQPAFALRTLEAAQECRRRRPLPLRHQRRHAHRQARRNRRRSAQALRRRARHPPAQRFRCRGRQRARRRRAGLHARAGLHERLRRALRQRQSCFDHRQPRTEARPHHHRPGEADRAHLGLRASSPNWPTCRCATISPTSARARSRIRAASTSAR